MKYILLLISIFYCTVSYSQNNSNSSKDSILKSFNCTIWQTDNENWKTAIHGYSTSEFVITKDYYIIVTSRDNSDYPEELYILSKAAKILKKFSIDYQAAPLYLVNDSKTIFTNNIFCLTGQYGKGLMIDAAALLNIDQSAFESGVNANEPSYRDWIVNYWKYSNKYEAYVGSNIETFHVINSETIFDHSEPYTLGISTSDFSHKPYIAINQNFHFLLPEALTKDNYKETNYEIIKAISYDEATIKIFVKCLLYPTKIAYIVFDKYTDKFTLKRIIDLTAGTIEHKDHPDFYDNIDITLSMDGGFYIMANKGIHVKKFNSAGDMVWFKTFGVFNRVDDIAYDFLCDDKFLYISGVTLSHGQLGHSNALIIVADVKTGKQINYMNWSPYILNRSACIPTITKEKDFLIFQILDQAKENYSIYSKDEKYDELSLMRLKFNGSDFVF
ncbi:MAG: hypothetical protein EOO87_14055 [Pedobacter sp.]|nr:MAG: hypothetical protein EOO87_14055 [Pedobacter sp.]